MINNKPKNNSSIFILFAPKFNGLGCDLGNELLHRHGSGKIHGICTGSLRLKQNIEKKLGSQGGKLWHLNTEEKKWLRTERSEKELSSHLSDIDQELGLGAAGRLLVADRRVGKGFVRGGLCRPDEIARMYNQSPQIQPQKYLVGLYNFIQNVLKATQPDLVFCYAVAGAPALALAEISKSKEIPFFTLNTTRIGKRYVVDDSPIGQLNCISQTYQATRNGNLLLEQEQKQAETILAKFRNAPEPPEYMKRNHQLLQAQTPWPITVKGLLGVTKNVAKLLLKKQSYSETQEAIARIGFNTWTVWRKTFVSRKNFAFDPPTNSPFIYFPLHVDPEASTMILSPWHTDQISLIEALAKSAPAEMVIVVKEHAPMLGKRPNGFYETISAMPRVILLGPEHNGLSLVSKAQVTVVITGTAAWEALRLKKPTVILGNSPFIAIGEGMVHEPCLSNLPNALKRALEIPPASDEALVQYIAASLAESFEMSSSLLWGEYEQHSEKERQEAVNNIVDGILKRAKN